MRSLVLLVVLLPGCVGNYRCGEFHFAAASGTFELGEWCGSLFGTYALENADGVQLIIDPAGRDEDAVSAAVFHNIVINVDIAPGVLAADTTLTEEDAVFSCVHSQQGAGTGDIRFDPPSRASLEVGPVLDETDEETVYRMTWEVDCAPVMTAVGRDKVAVSQGLDF
ncbi:MAG: hypothetical protein EP330_08900 [Deltaproteobacteria bacterium]|nr:MAG: hypothetical protein EP330_08900 [Deltaproteobacteria bacterium]